VVQDAYRERATAAMYGVRVAGLTRKVVVWLKANPRNRLLPAVQRSTSGPLDRHKNSSLALLTRTRSYSPRRNQITAASSFYIHSFGHIRAESQYLTRSELGLVNALWTFTFTRLTNA
jgi:hypothetical protein